jgi:hypothetical protein
VDDLREALGEDLSCQLNQERPILTTDNAWPGGAASTVPLSSAAATVSTVRTREVAEVNGRPAPQRKSLKQEDVKVSLRAPLPWPLRL